MVLYVFLADVANISGYIRKRIWHSEFGYMGFVKDNEIYQLNTLNTSEHPDLNATLTIDDLDDDSLINQIWIKEISASYNNDLFNKNWDIYVKYHVNMTTSLAKHYFIYNNPVINIRSEFEYLLLLMYALQFNISLTEDDIMTFNNKGTLRNLELDFRPFSCNEFIKRKNMFWTEIIHKVFVVHNIIFDIENIQFIKQCYMTMGYRGLNELSKSVDLFSGQVIENETDDQRIDELDKNDESFDTIREHLNLISDL